MPESETFTRDEECEHCINGHIDGCDALEPAHDIGDLIARSGCTGCCPAGCRPEGLQAEQDQAGAKARRLMGGR